MEKRNDGGCEAVMMMIITRIIISTCVYISLYVDRVYHSIICEYVCLRRCWKYEFFWPLSIRCSEAQRGLKM